MDGTLDFPNTDKRVAFVVEAIFGIAARFSVKSKWEYNPKRVTIEKQEMRDLAKILFMGIRY
ncbi:MAG: hypothetical protein AB9888_12820 [Bacteroidales bacterium]